MAGGVAANTSVRSALQAVATTAGLALVCPPPRLCTDNGVMVAWAGAERLALGLAQPPPPPLQSAIGAALPERLTVPVRTLLARGVRRGDAEPWRRCCCSTLREQCSAPTPLLHGLTPHKQQCMSGPCSAYIPMSSF